jgi:hypothetical protein
MFDSEDMRYPLAVLYVIQENVSRKEYKEEKGGVSYLSQSLFFRSYDRHVMNIYY